MPPTSSISQPPLLATIVRMMLARAGNRALAEAHIRTLLPKLMAYHRWWYRDRDPEQTGMVVSYHPWESGMDNSPAWDAPLSAVPATTREYQRRDTQLIDAAQRPHKAEYDRFLYLVDLFKALDFDPVKIYHQSPYRVADFGLNAILQRATLDLIALCEQYGNAGWADELRVHARRAEIALCACWSEELEQYISRDTLTNTWLALPVHSGFLAWYARLDNNANSRKLQTTLENWITSSSFGIASTHPGAPSLSRSAIGAVQSGRTLTG